MNTQFKDKLREAIFLAIGSIELSGRYLIRIGWDNSIVRTLNFHLKEGTVTKEELLSELHVTLKSLGRKSFNQHKQGRETDHIQSPHALAYAIQNNEFTEEEKRGINHDGDTDLDFIKLYNTGNLRQKILDQMLTEKDPILCDTDSTFCC